MVEVVILLAQIPLTVVLTVVTKWALQDSNLGPTGYEPAALTN